MKKFLPVIISIFCPVVMFVTLILVGFLLPAQFSQTYYGVLSNMYARLKETTEKKVVVLGNSSVAFGVDSALLEQELQKNGYEYSVCNFGLYGALGTKLMLDLSVAYINEGDIVIFSPELIEQTFSLYFSAPEVWRAADSDFSILSGVDDENKPAMVGCFAGYVGEKYGYYTSGSPAEGGEVYAATSFDERCDMKNANRAYNVMSGGSDFNNPIAFDTKLLNEEFINYLNAYYRTIRDKGAQMYYSFSPVNKNGLKSGTTQQDIDGFYDSLTKALDFSVLGNPYDCLLDYEWFYDSNVHMNAAGMTVRTALLAEEILTEFGCGAPVEIPLPEKPQIPEEPVKTDGNNEFADSFTYREEGGKYVITGLTEAGSKLRSVIIPYSYNDKPIVSFEAQVFQNNTVIEEVTIQDNITLLLNESFSGCKNLKKIILEQTNPEKISLGYSLLEGAMDCKIYVPKNAISSYQNNYTWGYYFGDMETY